MQSHKTQLLWQPGDSSVKESGVGGASQQGHMIISRLDPEKLGPKAAQSKAGADTGGGRRERLRLELLGEMQLLEKNSLMHNRKTLKLPTHLAKYISEIWKSGIQ